MINKHLVLVPAVLFFTSCAIVQKHEEIVSEDIALPAETPAAAPVRPAVLKKSIEDRDLKKNQEDQELKKRVVVLPFLQRKPLNQDEVLTNARNAFVDSLNKSSEMIALDAGALKLDLSKYIKDNMYDLKAIAKEAQSAGVSCILEGRIVDMRFKNEQAVQEEGKPAAKTAAFEIVVQARMLNIRSEQELFNTVKTVTIEENSSKIPENVSAENFFAKNTVLSELLIKDAFLDFNDKLTDSLKLITWEGRIAAMQGERIFLNVGQISGVQVGDILKVVEDGNEVYDTELGYHLGKAQGKVKGTLEIVGFFGQDGAVSVIHSGAGFKENDRVEIYQ